MSQSLPQIIACHHCGHALIDCRDTEILRTTAMRCGQCGYTTIIRIERRNKQAHNSLDFRLIRV